MASQAVFASEGTSGSGFEIVAAVITYRGRVALFRRSRHVSGDVGRWHCITGFLASHDDPKGQVIVEIEEETNIAASDLSLRSATVVEQKGADGNKWRIHAFHFESLTDVVKLNWEHDAVCWLHLEQLKGLPTVQWLENVLRRLSHTMPGSVSQGATHIRAATR